MKNDDNGKFESFSTKLISGIGYFWIILSVVIAVWQLLDFLFAFSPYQANDYRGWLIFAAVLFGCGVLAVVFTAVFPSLIEIINSIFDKRPEDEKYFRVTPITEHDSLTSTIFESLPYIEEDQVLLNSICNACFGVKDVKPDYDKALNLGRANGILLYRLGKNYLRVLNGIYALYALEKKTGDSNAKRHGKYLFYKNYFIVNDIGWSMTELTETEFAELAKLLRDKRDNDGSFVTEIISKAVKIEWEKTAQENGERLILAARDELKDGKYPKLYAQAIRHSLSFKRCRDTEPNLIKQFEHVIKTIKNKRDRAEMLGNMAYLQAILIYNYKDTVSTAQIEEALRYLDIAQKEYARIGDVARYAKCFNPQGKLLLKLGDAKHDEAIEKFKDGVRSARSIPRYDQVLINLQSLAEVDIENREAYARDGLSLAIELKNDKFEKYFNEYIRVKHIFLVRHGESEKNLQKTISGEGKLTDVGKKQISDKSKEIKAYLNKNGYALSDVCVYGIHKQQIMDSMNIIMKNDQVPQGNMLYDDDLLKPLNMGILCGVSEDSPTKTVKKALITLERWRNGIIAANELSEIPDIEPFDSYWSRAKSFIDKISENKITIVVCTTSVAVFLTQYLLNPDMTSEEYKCLDIPLGAVVHFTEVPNKKQYRLMNRDTRTNILYASVETN